MQELLKYIDVIILLIVVVFLFIALKRMLGKKVGYTRAQTTSATNESTIGNSNKVQNEERINIALDNNKYPEGSLSYTLNAISKADPLFNAKTFVENAKNAFNLILTKFASGEVEEIKPYISGPIYDSFSAEVNNRKLNNQKLFIKVKEFIMADIESAELSNNIARIKVKFITSQIREVYEDTYNLDNNNAKTFSEFWAFEKDLGINTSIWILVKTSKS